MDLEELPQKLTVVEGRYIGLEFASIYANFGSEVMIIQDGDVFLPKGDTDISSSIKSI